MPTDTDGLQVETLAEMLALGRRPKILYTIPDYQNPTGLSMSAGRAARQILRGVEVFYYPGQKKRPDPANGCPGFRP